MQISPHTHSESPAKTGLGAVWTEDFINKCRNAEKSALGKVPCYHITSHHSFVCTKGCFFLPVGSLIPCFCCWGGNEGAAGNSGNWIFYYYFRNIALIEQPRAVPYTDVIPKGAEAYVPEIKMTVKLILMDSCTESHKREILQCLQ